MHTALVHKGRHPADDSPGGIKHEWLAPAHGFLEAEGVGLRESPRFKALVAAPACAAGNDFSVYIYEFCAQFVGLVVTRAEAMNEFV